MTRGVCGLISLDEWYQNSQAYGAYVLLDAYTI